MPQRANVTSVEAIKAFRSNLLVYMSKARPALEEASTEVQRVRIWLESDRKSHWTSQMKRAMRMLEEAEGALFSAKLSSFQEASAAQQAAVQKARRAQAEADEKLRRLKQWDREYDNQTQPLLKKQEKLSNLLAVDVPNAVAYLAEVIDTLEKYAGIIAPSAASEGGPAPEATSSETGATPEAEPPAAEGKGDV